MNYSLADQWREVRVSTFNFYSFLFIIVCSVCHVILSPLHEAVVGICLCLCYFLCLPKESNQRKGPLPWSLRACSDANAQQSVIKVSQNHCGV